jgi:hypothetical protein
MKKSKVPPAQKFTSMEISVSNNFLGANVSKSRKVMSKVILPQKRKAPSPDHFSLRGDRRRVARKTRQEERKKEMLLFDKVIREEVNLIRGGGGGKKRAISDKDEEPFLRVNPIVSFPPFSPPPTSVRVSMPFSLICINAVQAYH